MSFAALTQRDAFTVHNRLGGADANGKPRTGHQTQGTPARGTWGTPGSRDIEMAGRMDVELSATLATKATVKKGDLLSDLRNKDWIVTHVRPLITHNRAFLVENRA